MNFVRRDGLTGKEYDPTLVMHERIFKHTLYSQTGWQKFNASDPAGCRVVRVFP
jgi:hypothetical protein